VIFVDISQIMRLNNARVAFLLQVVLYFSALCALSIKARRVGYRKYADKTKDHAMHGLLFCWIPAATYSPGVAAQ